MHGENENWQVPDAHVRTSFSRSNPSGPFKEISTTRMSGLVVATSLHGSVRIFGFAAHHEVRFAIDQQSQPLPNDRMIVDYKDSALFRSRSAV